MSAPAKNWPEESPEVGLLASAVGEELEAATAAAIDVDTTGLEGLRAIFLLDPF